MDRINNSKNFFIRNLAVIIAFFVPVICLIIMYAARGIYPFGEEMYLRSDMYHQYATLLKEFQSILKNGDSLLYSWNIGLGSDFPGTYAYYLATPVYWLVGLLPSGNIPEIMSGFIILKAGLMSATFTYYVQDHAGKRDLTSAVFGIFYAFSSYMAAYSWNLMWLDCLLLLPLITLGLERLVRKKKVILYTISLAVAILSNYYIAIMICIYLVMYFIYLCTCEAHFRRARNFFRTLGRFVLYSVIAGLMASATVLPAFINLSATASGSFNFPTSLRFYFNLLEMISHAVMNVEPTVLSGYIPNIYCTVGLFMIIPLFMISRRINYKIKIGKAVLMLIFLFSFSMNIPTYIWHGFHYPNSLSSRQSFIYIFLVLAMCYEVMIRIRTYKYYQITLCFIAGVIAMYGLQVLFSSEDYTVLLVSVSALFLALYYIWMMLRKHGRIKPVVMAVALLLVAITEAMINTNVTGYSTTNRTVYMADNADYSALLAGIQDDGFYRVEKVVRRTKNDGAWLNYRSASEFSSTTLKGISDFYEKMGMQGSTNSFSYYGHTPLTSAILGVKYELSSSELNDELKTLVSSQNGYYLYENKYSLPLGYMVDSLFLDVYLSESNTPFGTQNTFAEESTDVSDLFHIQDSVSGEEVDFVTERNGRGFIYIDTKLKSAQVVITRNGKIVSDSTYSSLENKQLVDIGAVLTDDIVTVTSKDDDVETITVYPAVMDIDKLDKVIGVLGKETFEMTQFSDTYVSGRINADKNQAMLTSIPCYRGWDVYVDGVKTDYKQFKNAFIAVPLSEGQHTVEFVYHSPGLAAAIIISIFTALLFVFICIFRHRKQMKKKIHSSAGKTAKASKAGKTAKSDKRAKADKAATGQTSDSDAGIIIPGDDSQQNSQDETSSRTAPVQKDQIAMDEELARMSARLAKISGELAELSEKPLEK